MYIKYSLHIYLIYVYGNFLTLSLSYYLIINCYLLYDDVNVFDSKKVPRKQRGENQAAAFSGTYTTFPALPSCSTYSKLLNIEK